MSFQAVRPYGRHILRPLAIADEPCTSSRQRTTSAGPTTSDLWHATTHTYVGTGKRIVPASWPPSRFEEEPSSIPDDARFTSHYDPATGSMKPDDSPEARYHLFTPECNGKGAAGSTMTSSGLESDDVPAPRIVVKRYIPRRRCRTGKGPGLTLFMLAGMGLPKEALEPNIDIILPRLHDASVDVAEIWTVDMPMSGETALANSVGYLYGIEKDIARDLLMFITAYLPLQPGQELPHRLPLRRPGTGPEPQPVRPNLHIIAHSMGGQASVLACAHAPGIAASLTLIDPAIIPPGKVLERYCKLDKKAYCLGLRRHYDSVKDLANEVKTHRRTKGWDDRVVEVFCQNAVLTDPKGGLCLVADPRLEWALYYDMQSPTNAFDRLADVRAPLNAIMPSRPFAVPPKQFEQIIGSLAQEKRLSWVTDVTHQLLFEKPEETSGLIADWLIEQAKKPHRARL